ncbi:ciliary microtubule-associated protein 2-like [Osmerus eperlanus]|uniref:ciliary microtubule-associated protein 2-like n=1 Tax=Osmerus eperlanus TaxID=29151 RepID=UPI002E0E3218
MAEKKFKGAPFGTQSARFDVSAVHPANKRVGTYTEISYCKRRTSELERNLGPGLYNADRGDFSVRATTEKAKGPGWKRAQEATRLAKIPHILYREAWENKHFLKTKVGPGTYRIPDFMEELEKKPGSVRGVCESREERFREPQSWTPGPGSYGKGGVPCAALEEKRTQSGSVDMELSSGLKRFPEDPKTCGPCPCTYTLKSSTDILLNKRTSKRGPYDLFTGPRDEPIVSGYFAAPKCAAVTPGDYSPESFSEQSTTALCLSITVPPHFRGHVSTRLLWPARAVALPVSPPPPSGSARCRKGCRMETVTQLAPVGMTSQKRVRASLPTDTQPHSAPERRDISQISGETSTHRRGYGQ